MTLLIRIGDAEESTSDSRLLITVEPCDFDSTAPRIALALAQPRVHKGLDRPTPALFRNGGELFRLVARDNGFIGLPLPPYELVHICEQHLVLERVCGNGRRARWRPSVAWMQRFLRSPYVEWIPPVHWCPDQLRPDGLPLGWSVIGRPEQLVFTDWT